MKQNKKALSAMGKFMSIVIIVVFLTFAISWLTGIDIPKILDLIIPNFLLPEQSQIIDYGLGCPIKIAKVINGQVYFCNPPGENCDTTQSSNIQIEGSLIQIDQNIDEDIGTIVRDTFLFIKSNLVRWKEDESGTLEEIKNDVTQEELIKIDGSYFLNSKKEIICANEIKTLDDFREQNEISIKKENVDGIDYYYNADDLIKNLGKEKTQLYLDKELSKPAENLIIEINGKIVRTEENSEQTNLEITLAEKSPQDITITEREVGKINLVEGQATDIFQLITPVENENNKIGIDSGGDPFTHVQYIKWNGNIYVKFLETNYENSETPYILMEYWNTYRSFKNVPSWAKAN